MKKLIGFAVVLIALFLSNNVFAQDRLTVSVSSGFGCSGTKHYEVASKDEINKDGSPYFTWKDAGVACKNSNVDSKTGWSLPSKEVLKAMYEQLHEKGDGGFAYDYYWSSSEFDDGNAWGQYFDFGLQDFVNKYNKYYRVRCVRAF